MVALDFLHDLQVRRWLDGVEPVWTQLTFDSLRALRQKPRRLVSPRSKSPLISVPNEIAGSKRAPAVFPRVAAKYASWQRASFGTRAPKDTLSPSYQTLIRF